MRFTPLSIAGSFLIEPERMEDDRGFFARTWCSTEMAAHGLVTGLSQQSISFNRQRGTLRGVHWQEAPYAETKLVRVTMGHIADLILDLRPSSATYLKHTFVELSAENRNTVYIPAGCAHGFLTLADNCELHYQMDIPYHPGSQRGARFNDPAFGIHWPGEIMIMSERDKSYPDYRPI